MKKGIIQEHIDYFKDNPERYWFKRKLYGWGWTPATKEGWAITLIIAVLIVLNILRFNPEMSTNHEIFSKLFPQTVLLILVLIIITVAKGEKPKWQWGIPKKEDDTDNPFE